MAMRDFGVGKKPVQERVQDEARAIMEVMDKSQGRPIVMKPLLSKFTANVICSVIFGKRSNLSSISSSVNFVLCVCVCVCVCVYL